MYILQPYDDLLQDILDNGELQKNRTGVDCLSVFGRQARYNVADRFPLLTRRALPLKSLFAELLWIVSGSTNINDLEKMGSKIWSLWRDEVFEQEHSYVSGALGPVYGFQLRRFGGRYNEDKIKKMLIDYNEFGFDQLEYVINEIKTNPTSRRILFSLWNPKDLHKQKLPPCHILSQFHINQGKKTISLMLTQRSADVPIGVPWNLICYVGLLYMVGQQTGYQPHEFIHSIGNAHIYVNQIDSVQEYLARPKIDSPKLSLNKAADIYSYLLSDFEIVDYHPHPAIKIPVAI